MVDGILCMLYICCIKRVIYDCVWLYFSGYLGISARLLLTSNFHLSHFYLTDDGTVSSQASFRSHISPNSNFPNKSAGKIKTDRIMHRGKFTYLMFLFVAFFSFMEGITTDFFSELLFQPKPFIVVSLSERLNICLASVGQFTFCTYVIAVQSWHIGILLMKNKTPFWNSSTDSLFPNFI